MQQWEGIYVVAAVSILVLMVLTTAVWSRFERRRRDDR